MAVVVDASLLVRLVSRGDWAERVDALLDRWGDIGEDLHAPDLLPYEVENALRGMVFARRFSESEAIDGLRRIAAVPVTLHQHPGEGRLLVMAGRQRTRAAYDASYLVLASDLEVALWTADRGLAATGRSVGIDTHFVGD